MKGYVYVLTNEAMPGLVKVGRSKHAAGVRAKQIYKGDTGVPLPFEVHFECLFNDCIEGEALVHEELHDKRINPDREFFACDPDDAALVVMDVRAAYHTHRVAFASEVLEKADIYHLAHQLNAHPFEITAAIADLRADELKPALARYAQRVKSLPKADVVELGVSSGKD